MGYQPKKVSGAFVAPPRRHGVDLLFTDDSKLAQHERVMKYGAKILSGPMGSVQNPVYRGEYAAIRTCSNCGAPSAPGECRYCHEVVK